MMNQVLTFDGSFIVPSNISVWLMRITEMIGCQNALFNWADSYDAKDWKRLKQWVAPTLKIDYSSFMDRTWEAMPAGEYIEMASHRNFLGNPLLMTQHLVGASTWAKISGDEVIGTHQMRVAHQRYTDESLTMVDVKGHAHGTGVIWYKRVDGVWKFAGVKPNTRWAEFDYDKIFADHCNDETA